MRTHQLWLQSVAKLGLVLMLGTSMSANAGLFSKSWKEEVVSHDGKIIVVERYFNLGDYPTLDSHNRSPLDQTITFTLPESNKKIFWKTEYRNDLPEQNNLTPLLLDVVGGVPYLAASPAGCIAYNKWQRPNPPYILFKYIGDEWKRIPLEEFPAELAHSNLMSEPDIRILKSYYSVEQVKEHMRGRDVVTEARTIMREALPESQLCPDWNSQRYRSPKPPLPMKPTTELKGLSFAFDFQSLCHYRLKQQRLRKAGVVHWKNLLLITATVRTLPVL